jgi:hypothetical protein
MLATPIFAKMAVSAANAAENSAHGSHENGVENFAMSL